MKKEEIIDKWNKEVDENNQWNELGYEKKFLLLFGADDITIEELKQLLGVVKG